MPRSKGSRESAWLIGVLSAGLACLLVALLWQLYGAPRAPTIPSYPTVATIDADLESALTSMPRLAGGWVDRPEELLGMVLVVSDDAWQSGEIDFSKSLPIISYVLPSPTSEESTPLRLELPKDDGLVLRQFVQSGSHIDASAKPLASLVGDITGSATIEVFASVTVGLRRQASVLERLKAMAKTIRPDQVLLWFPGFRVIKVRREDYAEHSGEASLTFPAFSANGKVFQKSGTVHALSYLLPDAPLSFKRDSGFSGETSWPSSYHSVTIGRQ